MIKIFLLVSLLQLAEHLFPTDAGAAPIFVHVMTPEQINETFNDHSKGPDAKVNGWAIFADDLSWCHIFVPPLSWATYGIWTHELRHCAEGGFHP